MTTTSTSPPVAPGRDAPVPETEPRSRLRRLRPPTGPEASPLAVPAGRDDLESPRRRLWRIGLAAGKLAFNVVTLSLAAVFVFVAWASATDRMQFVPLRTGSMSPMINTGDLAILRPVPAASVKVGDVIAFIPPGLDANNRYVHRVVKIDRYDPAPVVYTKGDANPVMDSWSPIRLGEQTVWKYDRTIRNGGRVVWFIQSSIVRKLLIAVGAVALFIPMMLFIWKPRKPTPTPTSTQ